MYYDSRESKRFIEGERAGLQASSHYARLAWSRAQADSQRTALAGDEAAEQREMAMRERYRVAHREAMSVESDLEYEDDGDLDEYGYAA